MAAVGVWIMLENQALVAATSVESGRFRAVEMPTTFDALAQLFDQLTGVGQGYLEVRSTDHEFPLISLGFRHGCAVIHCASNPERMSLLCGDGSVAERDTVEVPIMDDLATFSGDFVVSAARARGVLLTFVRGADPSSLGEWCDL